MMLVSYITKITKKMGKWQPNYEVRENEQAKKKTTQRIPLTNINGGLNNRQIVLSGMMIKKKRELRNIKGIDERYDLI